MLKHCKSKIVHILSLSFILLPLSSALASDLLVSSQNTSNVLRYDGRTGNFVEIFCAAGEGGLSGPDGLAFGADGNLFVLDFSQVKVLSFDGNTGNFIDTFVDSGTSGDSLIIGPDGNLYASDLDNDIVRKIDSEGNSSAFITGATGSTGVTFGPDGNIYVSSCMDSTITRFSGADGSLINNFVGANSGGLNCPIDLKFGPDGNLYVASSSSGEVLRFNGDTGAFLDVFVPMGSGGLSVPFGLLFRNDGFLYVSDTNQNNIVRYDATTGAFDSEFVTAMSGGLDIPLMMTTFPAGILQFSMSNFSVNEADGTANISINRTEGSNGEVTVQFNTSDGTAMAGTDYAAVSKTVTFADGELSQVVNVPIIDNNSNGADKTVNLTLSDPSDDSELGNPATAILTIIDNDGGGGGCQLGTQNPNTSVGFGILMLVSLAGLMIMRPRRR